MNFKNIDYLLRGTSRQREAHQALTRAKIFFQLKAYNPVLAGTIPLGIDVAKSDLDIICYWKDKAAFVADLPFFYGEQNGFEMEEIELHGYSTILARFFLPSWEIEIFGQNRPVEEQEAYRHMEVEYQILAKKGRAFREKIIDLKQKGVKTEPAFAQILGLAGDPYEALLTIDLTQL